MKVTIHRGASSIEVEGEFSEVEKVLDRWWAHDSGSVPAEELLDDAPVVPAASVGEKRARRSTRKVQRAPKVASSPGGFDADAAANQMKNDPRFELFLRKVILAPKGRGEKVKLVSWFAGDVPLTSGDVYRVLHQLGVKLDPSNVSRAMTGDAKQDYLVERSGAHPTYKLSVIGRANFEQWLLDDSSKA